MIGLNHNNSFSSQTKKTKGSLNEEPLEEEQNDMKIVRILLACGRYCALTPVKLGGYNYVIQCLTVLFILVLFYYTYYAVKIKIIRLIYLTVSGALVDCLSSLLEMIFIIVCVVNSNIFLLERWKTFYKDLFDVNNFMKRYNFQVKKKIFTYYCEIFIVFFISFALHGYQNIVWLMHRKYKGMIVYLGWIIAHFYMNFILLLTCYLAQALKRRFDFLNGFIKKEIDSNLLEETIILKLNDVISFYKTVNSLLENFNRIFGLHLFLYIALSVVYIVIDVILSIEFGLDAQINAPDYLITIDFIISLIVLIVYCHFAEKSGQKIIVTCYLLHESVKEKRIKDKLMELARYGEEWRPTFSAAGFYVVNQRTLNAIFDSVIDYIVILLQFTLELRG